MQAYYQIDSSISSPYITDNSMTAWTEILHSTKNKTLRGYRLWLNETAYDQQAWDIAPAHSVQYYEEQHARYIREKYDYVRVSYSGGSDSFSIVESFLRAGQKIDEIIMWVNPTVSVSNEANEVWVSEKLEILNKVFKKFNVDLPLVSFFKPELSDAQSHFSKKYYLTGAGYLGQGTFNYNQLTKVVSRFPVPQGISYATVCGLEKPRMIVEQGKVYFTMVDKTIMTGVDNQTSHMEWFYLNDHTTDLVAAQMWAVLKYGMIHHQHDLGRFVQQIQNNTKNYHLWCTLLGRTSNYYQNIFSLTSKPSDFNKSYTHVQESKNQNLSSWVNFQDFLNTNQAISRELFLRDEFLPGILTKKYYLCDTSPELTA
jgi:hypothetical protein